MKSWLTVSFARVADRERKHLGKKASRIRGTWALGRRIDLAFLGRLDFGPSSIGALGLGRLARGTQLGLMVPTVPHFPAGEGDCPRLEKRTRLIVIAWGTVNNQCCSMGIL